VIQGKTKEKIVNNDADRDREKKRNGATGGIISKEEEFSLKELRKNARVNKQQGT